MSESNKDKNIQALEEKTRSMNEKIDNFQQKLQKAPGKLEKEYKETLTDLRAKKARLDYKLGSLRKSGDDSYQDLKAGAQMAWEDLKTAFSSAKERFEVSNSRRN